MAAVGIAGHGDFDDVKASGPGRSAQCRDVSIVGWIERTSEEAETTEGHHVSLPGQLLTLQRNL